MDLIVVDESKCKQDGISQLVRPMALIRVPKGGFPKTIPGADKGCIDCGHCVAVCPHEALSQRAMTPADCMDLPEGWTLGAEDAERFLRMRRSIRQYKKETVDREKLQKLIEMARYAPTGHNTQSVRWLVITDPAEVKRLAGLVIDWMVWMIEKMPDMAKLLHMDMIVKAWEVGVDTVLRDAPHLVVAHAPRADKSAPDSCTIALSYLELAAVSLGLGTCWAGFFSFAAKMHKPLQEAIALPDGHVAMGAMMVGFPKVSYSRLPVRKPPRITWR